VLIDYLGLDSLEYPASIMGLCIEITLFSLVVKCLVSLNSTSYLSLAYEIWLLILEFSLIGQIASGVFFMMIRGCIRSKVQLRPINETKCLPETDALTANKDEINLFSSFLIPFVVLIEVPDIGEEINSGSIKFLKWSTAISFFAILVLIFVHWRKGPKWWTKIAPILFYSLTWLLFVVLPLSNICVALAYLVRSSNEAKAAKEED
jgi:hypothetical protein